MIQVSHESPLSLLKKSRKYNDYDYALVHLFEENKEYYGFFKQSLKMGRRVILDNSLFELKESFDPDRFAFWIKELKPTDYVVPDTFEDYYSTKAQFEKWKYSYSNLPGNTIGVIHGRNVAEAIKCYEFMAKEADKIAINAMDSYFLHMSGKNYENKYKSLMTGRVNFIDLLVVKNLINTYKKHHLLGNTLPQEGLHYTSKNYDWLESVDTSNPIVHGLLGIRYNGILGLETKDSTLLADLLHADINPQRFKDIMYNIYRFKDIWEQEV